MTTSPVAEIQMLKREPILRSQLRFTSGIYFSMLPQRISEKNSAKLVMWNMSRLFTTREASAKGELPISIVSLAILMTGLHRFGYVNFTSVEAAKKAIETFNMQNFEGRRLSVQFTIGRPQRQGGMRERFGARAPHPPTKTLFIGNMAFDMSDRDLNNLFREIKNVIDVRVAIDRRTGQPRGFAHADFVDVASAEKAMEALKDKEVCGRVLRVDYSTSSGRSAMAPAEPQQ